MVNEPRLGISGQLGNGQVAYQLGTANRPLTQSTATVISQTVWVTPTSSVELDPIRITTLGSAAAPITD
jgi:hypothetical protein